MNVALALDHVGVCARALTPLTEAYEKLGFSLSPIARQSGKRTPDGPTEPFGTGNRCAFLRHGYIELLAILDPELFDNQLGRFLDRYEGLHILALGIDDAEANLHRMRAAGIDIPGVAWLERPVDSADGPRARFARLPLPDAPEGRVQLIQHLTPELIWQPRWMDHANRADALVALILASDAPAEAATRLSRLAGLPFLPDPAGGFQLRLPGGAGVAGPHAPAMETVVRILPPDGLASVLPGVQAPRKPGVQAPRKPGVQAPRLPGVEAPELPGVQAPELPGADAHMLPFMAGMVVRTADGNAAVRAMALPLVEAPDGLMVPPALAGGAALVFAP